jgi:hypothetical protein
MRRERGKQEKTKRQGTERKGEEKRKHWRERRRTAGGKVTHPNLLER